ncbi:MAG: succinate dehydrogenase assembly factor 2 [Paracoccaceae bacterium]|nr:MAG: succinate dehydrogenase assembly factor 2 [Alphaproteobacteria bacterium]GIX14834.1 MAG: succinate dehydrogenase assembly factor 2 [Paracoccaceae bacterium]
MTETPEIRLRRLRLRSHRRGMKEMDLILGRFADAELAGLDGAGLDLYERLLEQGDQDLWRWVTGAEAPPAPLGGLIARIRQCVGIE